jgi:hypothetical protein
MKRREWLSTCGKAAFALGLGPLILTERAKGANDRIQIGVIGAGARGTDLMREGPPVWERLERGNCRRLRCLEAESGTSSESHQRSGMVVSHSSSSPTKICSQVRKLMRS